MTFAIDQWAESAGAKVKDVLTGRKRALTVQRVVPYVDTDSFGEDAWRLLLLLPRPEGETWKRDHVFELRRIAVDAFDELALAAGRTLEGRTVALVSTDDALDEDVAPRDVPASGEDPVRG